MSTQGSSTGNANLSALLLDRQVGAHEQRTALVDEHRSWTYAHLARTTGSLAAAIRGEIDPEPGSIAVLALDDSLEWVAAFLALTRLGVVTALVNPTLPADRLVDVARRARPAFVLGDVPDGLGDLPRLGMDDVVAAAAAGLTDPGPVPTRGDSLCYLLMTSGSTGPSRWAMHRHRDIRACLATYGRTILRLGPGDVTWSGAVLASSYGLGNSVYFPLGVGAAAWITGRDRSPAATERACRVGGVTVMCGVPTGWSRLARHALEGRVDPRSFTGVRLAVAAGEPLPVKAWHAVHRALGLRLVNGLGSSEATNLYLSDRPGAPRPGTVGWPVAGFALRLEPRDGAEANTGELLVRGASVMSGYLDNPEATAAAVDADGWLHTGDLLRRETDGSYTFLGRSNDRFKSGALWVDPLHVQAELLAVPGVGDAVVMGVPDGAGIVRVVAAVARTHDAPIDLETRLEQICAARLAAHERPRRLLLLDEMPMTASGKADRTAVRERLSATAEPAASTPIGGVIHGRRATA